MAVLLEIGQGTKREDLADLLSRIDSKGTPATSMIPKGKEPTNTLFEWVVDDQEAPASGGNVDGADFAAGAYGNMSPNRAKTAGRVQIFQKAFGVSTLAEEVSDVAGLGRKAEMRESIKKALTSIKRGIEARICGELDSQADNGTVPYLTRGLFSWLGHTGGAATQPSDNAIPTLAQTPTDHSFRGLTSALTEDNIQGLLEAVFNSTGGNSHFQLLCGTKLKRRFTDFSTYQPNLSGSVALRTYNQDGGSKKIVQTVDVFVGDFGQVDLLPTHWLRQDATGGTAAQILTRQQSSGLLLDTSLLKIRYNSLPTFKEVEDRGGGRKGFVRSILGLQVTNPKGLGAIVDTTT
jgi:hypothetical protein